MPRIRYEDMKLSKDKLAMIEKANKVITAYREKGLDLTLRQVYYQFVARDWFPESWADPKTGSTNNMKSYKRLGDAIADGRLCGLIDWNAIVDRTREVRLNAHWKGPQDIVEACAAQFQIDKWARQGNYIECWVEKDALIGVLEAACKPLDVPYYSCRGYNSASEIWNAGHKRLKPRVQDGKQCIIIYMGDHDPSGIDMTADVGNRLRQFSGSDEIVVERIALNRDQIDEYDPPENPTKMTDSRAEKYVAEHGESCWELDALDPTILIDLIREKIIEYREEDLWQEALEEEREHRRNLYRISRGWEKATRAVKGIDVSEIDLGE